MKHAFAARNIGGLALALGLALGGASLPAQTRPASQPQPTGPYLPKWESLTKHPVPAWFEDAKFGIYFHWGPYTVPAFGSEWYSHNMYVKERPEWFHHQEKYGHLTRFGYKDFIPKFTGEKFDADRWAELFEKAGAKFVGPVGEHADGFAMWDSRLTRWNATKMGPKRDVVGELEKAIRKRNMKFIVTLHHQWLWGWYPTWDRGTDAADPNYAGLYGQATQPGAWKYNPTPTPGAAFCRMWEDKIKEVIDNYQPDLLWFDSRMSIIPESYRLDFLAYYYNRASQWDREVAVTYKKDDLEKGAGILDLERGRMADKTDFKWLTDDSIDWQSWSYVEGADYKPTNRLITELVDIVSKNGNLLLNICPRADGTIPEGIVQRLLEMGDWLKLNGEAIYATRPWEVFGEGPTKVKGGSFGEGKIADFTAQDIRFTVRRNPDRPAGDALYAIFLDWPGTQGVITSLGSSRKLWFGEIGEVRMLGVKEPLKWSRDEKGLTVQMPDAKPCAHAFVLKITATKKF